MSAALRIVAGVALLAAAALAGWLARPPLAVAALIIVFAASFIVGRTTTWSARAGRPAPRPELSSVLLTIMVQCVLVGGLYLMGAGLAAVLGRPWALRPSSLADALAPLALGLACGAMGVWAARIDRRQRIALGGFAPEAPVPAAVQGPSLREEIRVLPEPVTPDTFYRGIHFSHGRYVEGGFDGTANEASAGSDDKILAAETRLGVTLPEGLRRLYRVQNGGSLAQVCIPKAGVMSPRSYDDIFNPFSGYNDLYPTECLTTAWDSFLAFADPEDQTTYGHLFTGGTERMIVLAQWYRESLVLDYNRPGEPRVGFMDFDHDAWMEHSLWWPDFETFFALLRHYEDA